MISLCSIDTFITLADVSIFLHVHIHISGRRVLHSFKYVVYYFIRSGIFLIYCTFHLQYITYCMESSLQAIQYRESTTCTSSLKFLLGILSIPKVIADKDEPFPL